MAPFPASRVTGGGGPEGEKREGLTGYLWRVLGIADADGGGGSTEQSGRRRTRAATVMLQRPWAVGSKSESSTVPWRRSLQGRFGLGKAGGGPSAEADGRRRLCPRRRLIGDDMEGRPGLGAPLERDETVSEVDWS